MADATLEGKILIAMPALADPNFFRTIVLLGSHSREGGAFGLVMNRPSEISLKIVLEQIGVAEFERNRTQQEEQYRQMLGDQFDPRALRDSLDMSISHCSS